LYEGRYLIFGGKRWKVVDVDEEKSVVELVPAKGGRAPRFGGMGPMVHGAVRREMRRVYAEEGAVSFLDPTGNDLLAEGRRSYRDMGLDERSFMAEGGDAFWFPWAGDRALNTLVLGLRQVGVDAGDNGLLIRAPDTTVDALQDAVRRLRSEGLGDPVDLAYRVQNKQIEKHHVYLRDDLLAADYASQYLDAEGAGEVLDEREEASERVD
jgi:ATP-dependent Lhr-like helicase